MTQLITSNRRIDPVQAAIAANNTFEGLSMRPDGVQERLDAEDLDHPLDVVGEYIEAHRNHSPRAV